MNFLKNLRSKMTLGSQKKSVRVLEDHLVEKGKIGTSKEQEKQQNEDQGEMSKIKNEQSEDDLAHIRRGYTTDSEDPKDVKILHSVVRIHWTDIVANTISLHNHYIWKIFMFGSTYCYFIAKMFQTYFLKSHGHLFAVITASMSDSFFLLNSVCVITIFFWKKLHLLFEKKSKLRLIFDGYVGLPFHTFYILAKLEKYIPNIHLVLMTSTFCRFYYIEEFFGKKSNDAGVKHWNYFVARYILRLVLLTHTLACMLFLVACPLDCTEPEGWTYAVNFKVDKSIWYLLSFFMAFINFANSGFNVFVPTNLAERLVITITMCIGFVLTTLILIGALSLDLVNRSYRLANMRIQLYAIRRHLKSIRMSRKDTDLILNYYRLFWKKKKGVKEAVAINILPLPLQMEISFDINYYLLQCSILFRNKPEPFLRTLSLNMKHEFFQPGEDIYVCNTIKNKMICVASGIIEVTSDEDYDSPIISFGKGSVLGEAALILSLPAKTTVRAANYCELQVLYKVDFIRIIHLYPEIFLQLRETVISRIEKFHLDEDRIQESSRFLTLNLYVSQKKHLSAIKRLKKRLLRERFDDLIPKNHHACDLYKYQENVKKMKGRYIFLSDTFPWILASRSFFMKIWQIIVFIDVITLGFTYPYFMAYHREFPEEFKTIANFIELIYYLDIYIILTTAIESKDYVAKTFSEILAIQLKSFRFYVELVSTIPFELIFYKVTTQIYVTIKLNRVLKSFRICTFFDKIEKKVLTHNILGIRLIKYFTYIVMVNYWFGILLYSSTCFTPSCTEPGWYRDHVETERKYKTYKPCSIYPTLMATYFGLTVLSTLGFNDIVPGNEIDLIILIWALY
ncbi:hypothetical protein WA026_020329 [Henosepilachna vigintioctopunctata]|uniref:Cyclic nucleotide-binding domain-containing protein n=1 Tax=Henosepilachna vigintioctopunctata TaxID=420089 RepID=A0AAW1TRL5_9CUCU